jgi:SAM-dependent methyltransferase
MADETRGTAAAAHANEVTAGERFRFGENWASFLQVLDGDRIEQAEASLKSMLPWPSLEGKRFLDAGSGSGLSSLAARRIGAEVVSFDYDPQSVACTTELRRRYYPDDPAWTVTQGSILDDAFLDGLGEFDVVYSWGVVHHTGHMWEAIEKLRRHVREDGRLFVAIYNDEGWRSALWRRVKRLYCRGRLGRALVKGIGIPYLAARTLAAYAIRGWNPIRAWRDYRKLRGMSMYHDWIDWLGGFPFEVARPEEVLDFCRPRGFELERLKTTRDLGCNEFVLRRVPGRIIEELGQSTV